MDKITAINEHDKPQEFWIPSCDTVTAKLCYKTEQEALKYAMRKSAMSCGAIRVIEYSVLKRAIELIRDGQSVNGSGRWLKRAKEFLETVSR